MNIGCCGLTRITFAGELPVLEGHCPAWMVTHFPPSRGGLQLMSCTRGTKAQLLFLKVKELCCASIFTLEPSRGWCWGEISVESYLCFILPLASPSSLTSLQVCLLRTLPHKSLAKLLGSGSATRDPVSAIWVARRSSCGSRPSWLRGSWGLLPVMYFPNGASFKPLTLNRCPISGIVSKTLLEVGSVLLESHVFTPVTLFLLCCV